MNCMGKRKLFIFLRSFSTLWIVKITFVIQLAGIKLLQENEWPSRRKGKNSEPDDIFVLISCIDKSSGSK